ncbi:PaaX family transcriptional regulator C-terminal domain-containing protein [Nocardioides antri]|uniref:PaaX domain-containing protein, C-domain protein n=1 Tax=Nocardioides antri TaxID=2607659 RepID=A0A5B1M5A6_9ACTN|nr:PaaX family transcriptional regulator C-terminal domain-containing protein [Nocardioides antri]KAA1427924.1 PaaX domain-containing protein, C- domain protein [Nocardioides antri]
MPVADLKPLPARSVVLSLLLGSHPDRMSPAQLTRAGEHFGIPASTLRVALTRAVAAGDLRRVRGDYVLGERLVARQRRQDEGVEDAETAWDGTWEMAVVVVTGRPGSERAALRDTLTAARLAELREGVWTRPANLRRAPSYAGDPVLTTFRSRPDDDPARLARDLWDLRGWATDGRTLLRHLERTRDPALRLAVAAHVVRHLTADPLLPPDLLPSDWPGADLRTAYAAYQAELRDLAVV